MNDKYLQILNCDQYSSLEEIKKSYRSLSLKYHPDTSENTDTKLFLELKEAYDFLIIHHKPRKKKTIVEKDFDIFYRIFDGLPLVVNLPLVKTEKQTIIQCIFGSKEFRVILQPNVILPYEIDINNISPYPIRMRIFTEKGYEYE